MTLPRRTFPCMRRGPGRLVTHRPPASSSLPGPARNWPRLWRPASQAPPLSSLLGGLPVIRCHQVLCLAVSPCWSQPCAPRVQCKQASSSLDTSHGASFSCQRSSRWLPRRGGGSVCVAGGCAPLSCREGKKIRGPCVSPVGRGRFWTFLALSRRADPDRQSDDGRGLSSSVEPCRRCLSAWSTCSTLCACVPACVRVYACAHRLLLTLACHKYTTR